MGRYILARPDESETGREISITEVDIDSFIRAKGAIFSAINIMLSSLDMDVTVLEHVYVAGGIGSGINMENAVRIGMLPDIDRSLFTYLGNTSLAGAYAMVRSELALELRTPVSRLQGKRRIFRKKGAEQLMLCAFYGFGLLQKRNRIGERLACCTAQRLHFRRRLDEVRHQEHGKAAGCAGKQTVA